MEQQSTGKGFAILSIAGILTKVLSLLYIPMLVAIIDVEGLGVYQKVYEVFTFAYAITSIGLQVGVAKLVSELAAKGNHTDALRAFKLARNIMCVIGFGVTICMMGFADTVAQISSNPRITYGIIALAPTIVITTALVSYRGYFQAYNYMNKIAVSQIIEEIVNKLFSLGFAYILINISIEAGAAGGTIGTSLGALVAVFYLIYLFKHNKLYEVEDNMLDKDIKSWSNKKILRRLIKYTFPIALSAGLQNFGALVDMFNVSSRLMSIGYSVSESDIAYGMLGQYKTIMYVPLIIITSLGMAVLPAIVRAVSVEDKELVKEKIVYALKMTLIISIPSAIGMMVLNKEIYLGILGNESGTELMLFGGAVVILMALVQIQNTILQSVNQFYYIIITLILGIIAKLASNYYLIGIPEINIMGAVVGGYLCFIIPAILNNNKLKKTLRIKFSLIKIGTKPFISSSFMAIGIIGLRFLIEKFISIDGRVVAIFTLIPLIIVAIAIYGVSMIVIGGITKKDLEEISPKLVSILPEKLRIALK